MLEGLIQVFWYSTTPSLPPADPDLSCENEFYLHGNQKSSKAEHLTSFTEARGELRNSLLPSK